MDNQKYFYDLHESYSQEIFYLKKQGSKLLRKIKLQETKMKPKKTTEFKTAFTTSKFVDTNG